MTDETQKNNIIEKNVRFLHFSNRRNFFMQASNDFIFYIQVLNDIINT